MRDNGTRSAALAVASRIGKARCKLTRIPGEGKQDQYTATCTSTKQYTLDLCSREAILTRRKKCRGSYQA